MAIKDPDFDAKIEYLTQRIAAFKVTHTPLGLSVEVPGANCELFLRTNSAPDAINREQSKHVRIVQSKTKGVFAGLRLASFRRDALGGRGWNPMELIRENEPAHKNGCHKTLSDLRLATYALMAAATELNTGVGIDGQISHGYQSNFAKNKDFGLGLGEDEAFVLYQRVRHNYTRAQARPAIVFGPFGKIEAAPKR